MRLAPATAAAVAEFAARVRASLGPRLARLVLFGSHARGEATEDSDVDILVLMESVTSADARAIDEVVADILTRSDVLLSPLLLTATRFDELRARERRLAREIDREGVPV
jgi:predicted nucleotidyltransferase